MPYPLQEESTLEVVLDMRLNGQQIMMVRHYRQDPTDAVPIDDGQLALEEFLANLDDETDGLTQVMSQYVTSDLTFIGIQAQWIHPIRYAYIRQVCSHTEGTQAPPTLPQNVCGVVTLQTDFGLAGGHSNVFVAGLESLAENGGMMTGLAKGHLAEIGDMLTFPINPTSIGRNLYPIVYNRNLPTQYKPLTHYRVQDTVRTMRRRTVGRGS